MGRKLTKEEKEARRKKMEAKKLYEHTKSRLARERRRCERSDTTIPPSRRLLKPGDRVEIGNLDWSAVLEVFDGGKFVKILTINETIEYGKVAGTEFRIWYRPWVDCLPYRTVDSKKSPERIEENDDIRFSYSQRSLDGLLSTYYDGSGMDLDPDYQRGHVWAHEQKVALIDSVFRNIDIGKFTVIRKPFRENRDHYYEMLDGKQRFTALMEFFEDRFQYRGLYFSELHWRDQNHFENYSVSYAETEPLTDEQKYHYFLKLNVSGRPVDPAHIEKVEKMLEAEKAK